MKKTIDETKLMFGNQFKTNKAGKPVKNPKATKSTKAGSKKK